MLRQCSQVKSLPSPLALLPLPDERGAVVEGGVTDKGTGGVTGELGDIGERDVNGVGVEGTGTVGVA